MANTATRPEGVEQQHVATGVKDVIPHARQQSVEGFEGFSNTRTAMNGADTSGVHPMQIDGLPASEAGKGGATPTGEASTVNPGRPGVVRPAGDPTEPATGTGTDSTAKPEDSHRPITSTLEETQKLVNDIQQGLRGALDGVSDPKKFVEDAVNAANKLNAAPDADRQRLFSEAISESLKNHPEAAPGVFGRVLNGALEGSNLRVVQGGTVASLVEGKGRDSRVVAQEVQGDTIGNLQEDRTNFETAKTIARIAQQDARDVPVDQLATFEKARDNSLAQLEANHLLTNHPDVGARTRTDSTPGVDQVTAYLTSRFTQTFDGKPMPQNLPGDVANLANKFAFSNPGDMQKVLTDGMRELAANNPGVDSSTLTSMFRAAATNFSNDLSVSTESGVNDVMFVNDNRLAGPGNDRGKIAAAMVGGFGSPEEQALQRKAFDSALNAVAEIRRATAGLDPQAAEKRVDGIFDLVPIANRMDK